MDDVEPDAKDETMILLTGFEPFTTGRGLELTHNPTADIARSVAADLKDVMGVVLPVSYQETRRTLEARFESLCPRGWVGLGYAPHRTQVDIETIALNVEHAARPDNDGDQPFMRPIIKDAHLAYQTRLDVTAAIADFAEHGVQAFPCLHAGAFLCNQTFYLGCHRVESVDSMKVAAFIHVPPMDKCDRFTAGLKSCLQRL